LQQGKIDLIVATMNESPERRKQIDIIDPGYYASGATILARKREHIKSWSDLANKTVCAQQGAFYNKPLAEKYNVNLAPYAGVTEMNQALLDDRCFAEINDSVLVSMQLQDPKWADYESNVDPEFVTPFVMAVRKGQDDAQKLIGRIVTTLHKDGKILELAKKWQIGPTPWLLSLQAKSGT
jgi:polar amino acid transport system substrate-binding protein